MEEGAGMKVSRCCDGPSKWELCTVGRCVCAFVCVCVVSVEGSCEGSSGGRGGCSLVGPVVYETTLWYKGGSEGAY